MALYACCASSELTNLNKVISIQREIGSSSVVKIILYSSLIFKQNIVMI